MERVRVSGREWYRWKARREKRRSASFPSEVPEAANFDKHARKTNQMRQASPRCSSPDALRDDATRGSSASSRRCNGHTASMRRAGSRSAAFSGNALTRPTPQGRLIQWHNWSLALHDLCSDRLVADSRCMGWTVRSESQRSAMAATPAERSKSARIHERESISAP